jgi:hypothetical protein
MIYTIYKKLRGEKVKGGAGLGMMMAGIDGIPLIVITFAYIIFNQ